MKLPKELPSQYYWRLVDELEGRGLDLSYPEEVIKGIKRVYINKGLKYFMDNNAYTVFINHPQDNIPYETTLTPNVCKVLRQYMIHRERGELRTMQNDEGEYEVYIKPQIPSTKELLDIFLEQDKYFSMCLALRRELPSIVYNIKIGNYKYAALTIAALTSIYNMEIVGLINDYFQTHKFFDKKQNRWYSYLVINNRTYIVSNEVYVAVLIYRYEVHGNVPSDHADLMYENYDVLTMPDKEHTIKRNSAKSFLLDCKDVARVKKELNHTTIGMIEFHDLIRYGGYNDKILSIENLNKVSEIFGHKKWLHQFFVALSLYCDHYINLDDLKNNLKSDSKAVADMSKLKDIDLFLQAVNYFDSIYDTLIAND